MVVNGMKDFLIRARWWGTSLVVVLMFICFISGANAEIFHFKGQKVNFASSAESSSTATWSTGLAVTEGGIGRTNGSSEAYEWILLEPLEIMSEVGNARDLIRMVSIYVTANNSYTEPFEEIEFAGPKIRKITLGVSQFFAYVRYSDSQEWSSWQHIPQKKVDASFSRVSSQGAIRIPLSNLDSQSNSIPHVKRIQILLESSFASGMRISSIEVGASFGTGGLMERLKTTPNEE